MKIPVFRDEDMDRFGFVLGYGKSYPMKDKEVCGSGWFTCATNEKFSARAKKDLYEVYRLKETAHTVKHSKFRGLSFEVCTFPLHSGKRFPRNTLNIIVRGEWLRDTGDYKEIRSAKVSYLVEYKPMKLNVLI